MAPQTRNGDTLEIYFPFGAVDVHSNASEDTFAHDVEFMASSADNFMGLSMAVYSSRICSNPGMRSLSR